MDPDFWKQVLFAALGGGLTFLGGVRADRRSMKREREARHEDHLWRRRAEFETLLADFVPVYERWSWLRGALVRRTFGAMADTDPEPEEGEVESLADDVRRYIAQLELRSPSVVLDAALVAVSEAQKGTWVALIRINHEMLYGTDEGKDEAYTNYWTRSDQFEDAVRHLGKTALDDGRRRRDTGYGASPAQGQ